MEILIEQKSISLGSKYNIFVNRIHTHHAIRDFFQRIPPTIDLFEKNSEDIKIRIKDYSWYKPQFDIFTWDYGTLNFITISFWKNHYQCKCQEDVYDIYGHKGRKYSIFKNNIQIAYFSKEMVSFFAGDAYTIIANNDAHAELLISFCLIIDNFGNKNNNAAITIDFGNLGWFSRKFNYNWKPEN